MTRPPFLVLCCATVGFPCVDPTSESFFFAGHYSLSFHYTGVSRPGAGLPSFQATGYLNDQAFLHYDSGSGVAEPLGPWTEGKGMVDWEKETQLQKAREDFFMKTLKEIMGYYNDRGK